MLRPMHALVLVLATSPLAAQDWPAWRGPTGDGVAPEQSPPLEWSAEKNVKWRTPLAQPGNGSPIVSNGRVFLAMQEDEEGMGRSLYCFERETGAELWARTVAFERVMPTHKTNPYCSTTPAADGERVVVWHASAGLHAYDFEGDALWSRDLGEFRHMWGHGTSPVIHDGRVILQSGPGERSFVAAFDLESGETLWEAVEPNHLTPEQVEQKRIVGSWCTPVIRRSGERDLVLCAQPTRVVAYDAADGAVVWECGGLSAPKGDLVYSSPVVTDEVCMIQGGYEGHSVGVKLGGAGDVTESRRAWLFPEQMSNCGSGVHVDGSIYLPDMGSQPSCLDAATGETRWKQRLGRGNTWGSVVAVGERLYLTNQNGTTFVFEANPKELVVLAENALEETTNATPAFADGEVFLRTHEHLYCVAELPE